MTKSMTYAITGVASGIGAELAKILRANGHRVIGFDLPGATAQVDRFIPIDLYDPAHICAAAAQVDEQIDGLCNNAGIPPRDGAEQHILQINFLGQRMFTNLMLDYLRPQSAIVNMASRAGHGWPQNVDQIKRFTALTDRDALGAFITAEGINATRCYNLSKEAMLLWTLAITEPLLARDLRAVSLSPGGISTGIFDDFKRAFGDVMAQNIARAGRPGRAEEVAQVAAFALSPQAHWLKGVDIPIDGGIGAFGLSDRLGLDSMIAMDRAIPK